MKISCLLSATLLLAVCTAHAADADLDGLPDAWEATYGLSTNSADSSSYGIGDWWDDPDGDGLANHTEHVAGTCPTNAYSVSALTNDYQLPSDMGSYMGADLTDNDHVEDAWEARHTPAASLADWDEDVDWDGDGWGNWEERQAGTSPLDALTYPQPNVVVTLRYDGATHLAGTPKLVLHVYRNILTCAPEAVYVRTLSSTNAFPLTITLGVADLVMGHVRSGQNWVYAFLDLDGSTCSGLGPTWTLGEPAGVGGYNTPYLYAGMGTFAVSVGLADVARSFARLSWASLVPAGDTSQHTIALYHAVGGQLVLTRAITPPRTWLHEGDVVAGSIPYFGLAWGVANGVSAYRWTLDGIDRGVVTNIYTTSSLAAPSWVVPDATTNTIRAARPIFSFTAEDEIAWYKWSITDKSSGGATFATATNMVDMRAPGVAVSFTSSFSAGDLLSSGLTLTNGLYWLFVQTYSPADTSGSTVSAARAFRWDVRPDSTNCGGFGWIQCAVNYPWQTLLAGKHVRVEAFDNPGWSGAPACSRDLSATTGTVTLAGLVPTLYYIRAFVDLDGDRIKDSNEPWGYVRSTRDRVRPFRPLAVPARTVPSAPVSLEIRDP